MKRENKIKSTINDLDTMFISEDIVGKRFLKLESVVELLKGM